MTAARAILDAIEANLRGGLVDQAIETARARGVLRPQDIDRIERRRKGA